MNSATLPTACLSRDRVPRRQPAGTTGDTLREAWDQYVLKHPKGSIFHTSPMIEVFQSTKHHTVLPLAALDADGQVVAMLVGGAGADPCRIRWGRLSSRSIWYAEPAVRRQPSERRRADGADRAARPAHGPPRAVHRGAAALGAGTGACGAGAVRLYVSRLFELRPWTCPQPLESLWCNMRQSARRGVRKAEKFAYHLRTLDTPDSIDMVYRFLEMSYRHAKVPMADRRPL